MCVRIMVCECVYKDLNSTHLNSDRFLFCFLTPLLKLFSPCNCEPCLPALPPSLTTLLLLTAAAGINGMTQEVNNHETTRSGPFLNTAQWLCVCVCQHMCRPAGCMSCHFY